jgi:effector-binding domain-containing protein
MYRVEERDLTEQPTLVTRARLRIPDIRGWIGPAFGRVIAAIQASGSAPSAPPFARYQPVEDRLDTFDVEAGFPVAGPITPVGDDIQAATLPAGPAAVTVHVGPYDEMTPAYDALEKWVADRGGAVAGAPWESYLSEPVGDPSTWMTQVVLPYSLD